MATITLTLHYPPADMPDADTDVIVFDESSPEGQLGAYVGHESDGPVWADAQGGLVHGVKAWCEMPRLPSAPAARELVLRGGARVDLGAEWRLPG